MSYFSPKKEAATTIIEQPTLSPAVPFKMNFYVERDSLIESKVEETISDDKNINYKRQKTSSDSFIKRNGNLERDSDRKDFANMENRPLGFKSFPFTSFPSSIYKDLENDAKKQTQNYADKISMILSRGNTKEKSRSFAGNYNKTFINFVKPAKQLETCSEQVKASTDQLLINKNDHLDRTTQAVNQIVKCNSKKVNSAKQAVTNKKIYKTEIANLIQMLCEKCKNTKDVDSADNKCIECKNIMKYQCLRCRKIYKYYAVAYGHVKNKRCKLTSTDHPEDFHNGVKCRKCNARFECQSMLKRHYFFDCKKHKFYSMMKNYCSACQKPMPTTREGSICVKCRCFTLLQCVKCETMCLSNIYAYKHIRLCYKNIALCCNYCDYKTCIKAQLIVHIESKHTQTIYSCIKCSEICDSNAALERHRMVVHGARRKKIILQYCPSCAHSLDTMSKEKMPCFMCGTTLEHQCVFCYSRFPDYDTGYTHVTFYCKDPDSYSRKLDNITDATDSKMNVQSKNAKSEQNVLIEYRNIPNAQQYNVQNYGNIDIKKENNVHDVQIGASNSYENNFNVIKNNSNDSSLLNSSYTSIENLENLEIENLNIPNIKQYFAQIHGNFDIKKENAVQNHDVQIRASNSYENHFNAIKNNFDNSSLINSSFTTNDNSERSVNNTRPFCLSCGLKSDNSQVLEYHRLYGCLKTQQQTPINAAKSTIIVCCYNCELSYYHFNGPPPKWCIRCTAGGVVFTCGSCRLTHSSFTFIKDHTEVPVCRRYVGLTQFPYPHFPTQQFYPVNVYAPISYPHMYPTNYSTYQ